MDSKKLEASLRLFKGYILENGEVEGNEIIKQNNYLKCVTRGITFDSYVPALSDELISAAIDMYGIDAEKWNQTFHKSFATVRDASIATLIAQQLIHYFTTYGLEALGVYEKDLVYIPHEQLEIPELDTDIELTVIRTLTPETVEEKLFELLTSGIALSKQTVEDVMTLSEYLSEDKIYEITNKEVKTALFIKYDLLPSNPDEFLRYLIKKTIKSNLVIRNKSTLNALRNADKELLYNLLSKYMSIPNGENKLGQIFLRRKDIFLSMKVKDPQTKYEKGINSIINRIMKMSREHKQHKPLQPYILDNVTKIKTQKELEEKLPRIIQELDTKSVFREIRILNAISYIISGNNNKVYKVRNGKAFAEKTEPVTSSLYINAQKKLYDYVKLHLASRLSEYVSGKVIYIPDGINYTVPTTEKQFLGNIPQGSYVEVPRVENMVIGVHWCNLPNERVDLDLHMQNKAQQFGWNTSWRSNDLYYSGDVTDAILPKGATELFYLGQSLDTTAFLLTLNKFTRNKEAVPYEIVIATMGGEDKIERNYVIDPNKILIEIPRLFETDDVDGYSNQITLGLVTVDKTIRFYFDTFSLGDSIVTRQTNSVKIAYDYVLQSTETQLKLRELLEAAGAIIQNVLEIETMEEVQVQTDKGIETLYRKTVKTADIDLSTRAITKDSIISLLTGGAK